MTPERRQRIEATACTRQHDLTVLMERVHKPHNLAAVLRTCDAVGIQRAHAIPGNHGLPALNHTSQGAQRWIDLERHTDTKGAMSALKTSGFACYAAHFSQRAVDFRTIDYTQPTALVLGTEKFGVSEEALALCDGEVIIPMAGMTQSLNVSVAAAVILYEAQRQREAAGLYTPRDPAESPQRELIERWIARDLARRKTPLPDDETSAE